MGDAKEEMAERIRHARTSSGLLQVVPKVGMRADESSRTPHHQGDVVHAVQIFGQVFGRCCSAELVAPVIDLFAMIGEIHHRCILIAQGIENDSHHIIIISRSVVVFGHLLPFGPSHPRATLRDIFRRKNVEGRRVGIFVFGIEMLPVEVEEQQAESLRVSGGMVQTAPYEVAVERSSAAFHQMIGQRANARMVDEAAEGVFGKNRTGGIELIIPHLYRVARLFEDDGKQRTRTPVLPFRHIVAAQ